MTTKPSIQWPDLLAHYTVVQWAGVDDIPDPYPGEERLDDATYYALILQGYKSPEIEESKRSCLEAGVSIRAWEAIMRMIAGRSIWGVC